MTNTTEEQAVLEVRGLCVSFKQNGKEARALRGVDLILRKGEILCLVGESGSGKSLTARAIMGLLPAAHITGSVLCKGREILGLPDRKLDTLRAGCIAIVLQDPMSSLDPIMKVGRQITEVLALKKRMRGKKARAKALELMREVGINQPEKRFEQYPFELSGGLRQRAVIAMALAADPEILICDEPTTAQDVTVQSKILQIIKQIREQRGIAVLFITHDLGVVASIADTVAVMYAGRIVEYGTVNDIFYFPVHPYSWALISASDHSAEEYPVTDGEPPDVTELPKGDPFAWRNRYALEIDFEREPPMFRISQTHYAATWLAHPFAPRVEPPEAIRKMRERYFGSAVSGEKTKEEGHELT